MTEANGEGRTYDLLRKSVRFASQTKPKATAVSMFHLSVKPISRSAGRSATAAAAYRSGAEIVDERTGEVHDYRRKSDIEHSEILVPPGSPPWAEDRPALWNAAEASEKRKDARVARDYEIAIPKELTRTQGIELVRDFSAELVDRYGVAVDFNVHRDEMQKWDGSQKGWQGYHAHVLTSTRKLGRDGFGDKAEPELSDAKRKTLGLGDGASEVARVRELWAVLANRHLEQANEVQRIDSRSLKDQGIDRDPTVHLGPHVTALERAGIPSRLGDINRQVVADYQVRLEEGKDLTGLQSATRQLDRTVQAERLEQGEDVRPGVGNTPEERQVDVLDRSIDLIRWDIEAAVDRGIVGLAAERGLRVQRVLDRAQKRQDRREALYQTQDRHPPAPPRGLLGGLQQKSYQKAMAAWEVTKNAAAKLVDQAKRLTERLRAVGSAMRLLAWSQEVLRGHQPELVARHEQLQQAEREPPPKVDLPSPQPSKSMNLEMDREPEAGQPSRSLSRDVPVPASMPPTRPTKTEAPEHDPPRTDAQEELQRQAAEGAAAFRARYEKIRQAQQLEKTVADGIERIKTAAQAERERRARSYPTREPEHDMGIKPRGRSR